MFEDYSLDKLIEKFYQLNYGERRNPNVFTASSWDGNPDEMIVSQEEEQYGRIRWRLLLHRSDIYPGFAGLEDKMQVTFPHSFKLWYSRYFTLNARNDLLYLPISPSNYPLYGLVRNLNTWDPSEIFDAKLIIFGQERNGIGPLCFDMRKPIDNHDYPIVIWDHEDPEERVDGPIFSSFRKLLECCVYFLEDVTVEPRERRTRIAQFREIDPSGAGSTGKWYWSAHRDTEG